jgi:hypothetical protein
MIYNITAIAKRDAELKVELIYKIAGNIDVDFTAEADIPDVAVDAGFNVSNGSNIKPKNMVMRIFKSDESLVVLPPVTYYFNPEYFDATEEDLTVGEMGSTQRVKRILEGLVGQPVDLISSDGTEFSHYCISSVASSFANTNGTTFTLSVRELIFATLETTTLIRKPRKKKGVSSSGKFNMVEDTPGAVEILQDDDDIVSDLFDVGAFKRGGRF